MASIVQQSSFEDYGRLVGFLRKTSDLVLHLSANTSGFSKDVDGQLVTEVRGEQIKYNKSLFKLEGGSCKILSAV